MQADVRAVMSGRRQQRQFTSISSVAAALTRQHGIAGLWRGGLPAVQRAALVNLGELSTYDSVSHGQCLPSLLAWACICVAGSASYTLDKPAFHMQPCTTTSCCSSSAHVRA